MAYSMSPMQAAMLLVALVVGTCVGSVNAGHALNAALMQGDKEKMREIIESGAEGVNHMEGGEDGMSALYFATMLDDVDMVEYLLHDLQADPMIGDYRGFRPIDVGASASLSRGTCIYVYISGCLLVVCILVVVSAYARLQQRRRNTI